MPQLSFKIQADYDKVQRLREEIAKLKQEIKGVDVTQTPQAFNVLNAKLVQTSQELGKVEGKIIAASATMETDFKQKIFAASQSVNGFTEKIIAQKAVVKDVAADVKRLAEEYQNAAKHSPMMASDKLAEWKAAKRALYEEKAALFGLTQEQATARLSVKKLRDEYALFKQEGGGTAQTMDLLTSKMKGIAATIMGGMGLKELASHIISVRAEFESMETSLKVLLGGNQERLNSIVEQIKDYALASPLNTKDMVGAVQMMTSFGIEAEKSIDYLKAIGDISMGDTGKFNSLALAFSQMSSAGKLMGQDLLQMVNAGFNPLEEISRKTGKSIGQLKEEMSKGAISSKMVQDAFISATSAGGKFFGMSQEGAKTLNGQISMLQESFDMMFNEIGQKGEGVVMGAVQTATKLVENYERTGRVIAGLVAAYGTYRTAVAIATVAENGHTFAMTLARTRILLTQKAQALLNATMLANPYVLAAAALGTLVGAVIAASDGLNDAERAQRDFNNSLEEAKKKQDEYNQQTEEAISNANNDALATGERRKAMDILISRYPSIIKKYIDEEGHLRDILGLKREIARLNGKEIVSNLQNQANLYKEYVRIIKKLKSNTPLTEKEKGLYQNAKTAYDKNTPWYKEMNWDNGIAYYTQKAKEADKQAGRTTANNAISEFQESIGKMGAKRLETLKKTLDNAKKTKKNVILSYKELNGAVLNQSDIDKLSTYVDGVYTSKTKRKITTKRDLQEQKKSLQAQLDGLSELEAKGKKGSELKKKIAALTKRENDAYFVTPKSNKRSGNTKQIDYDKMRREQSDAERNLEISVAQSRIDAMQEGYEKERAQRELNHKKELEDIDKQRRDFLQRKRDDAKRVFEADPKNKGKEFNASSVTLSTADNAKFDEMRANAMEKHLHEGASYEDKLIREHQSYTDKRLELERKYSTDIYSINQAIKEAETRNDKDRVEALKRSLLEVQTEFGKSKMTLAFNKLKESPQYSVAYDDLDNASSETIENLLKRFEEVKEAAGSALDPENARAYFGAINGMIDELIERDPVGMLSKLSAQLKEQELSLARSKNILERVRKGENIIKGVNYDKETKKWIISYYDLASAEEEVAVKGKEVAETTNKIVKAEKKLSERIKELAGEISNLGNAMGGQTGQIISMFGSILSFYQTTADGITAVARTGANALSTIEKASVILSIISAAIQLMGTLSKMLPSTDDFYQKAAKKQAEINKLRKSVEDYRLSVLKAQQSENNWFSSTGLQSLKDAYVENGKVAEAYYSELYEAQEKYIDKSSGLKKAIVPIAAGLTAIAAVAAGVFTAGTGTAAVGALGASLIGALSTTAATATVATAVGAAAAGLAGAIAGSAIQSAVSSITYKNGQTAAVDNLRIQTRHKSFWRGQKTADLRDWVKEKYGKDLFDKDGMIDADLANAVLKDYGDKLQGETKQTLEELVKLREKYDEFRKQIRDYVSEMYSPLVSDMADAVWEWLENGKSALAQFKEKASETFADIAKEMIKQAILSKIFGSYKDDLQKMYETYATGGMSEKDLANNVGILTDRLLDRAEKGLPQIEELATYINEQFEKRGFNTTGKATSQTATINEARNLSEDTGSQIVGRLTAAQIAVESGNVKRDAANVQLSLMNAKIDDFKMTQIQTRDIADETRTILADSYLELKEINTNTGNSAAHLKEIRSDIKDLKKIMDDKL